MVPLSESNCDTQRQLTGATVGGKTYSYEYNSSGIRTRKTNYDGGYTEYYVVNGLPVAEQRFRANGTKQYILRYLYDESNSPVGFGIYYPTASSPYWQYYYFGKNLQGDVIALYRSDYNSTSKTYTPTLVATYTYDPWGAPTGIYDANGSTISQTAYHVAAYNPFRYRGYRYDGDTRLYYLQSRYYDPVVGRFINADVYASTGQGFIGHNMFSYCGNNPENRNDSEGRKWIKRNCGVLVYFKLLKALRNGDYVDPNKPPPANTGYTPPKKNSNPGKVKTPNSNKKGWPAKDGGVWVPDNQMDGGPGWVVQYPDGSHKHVYPDGHERTHNFMRKVQGGLILATAGLAVIAIMADDATGVGAIDDAALPFLADTIRKGAELIAGG